jgi:hypothetical protein
MRLLPRHTFRSLGNSVRNDVGRDRHADMVPVAPSMMVRVALLGIRRDLVTITIDVYKG